MKTKPEIVKFTPFRKTKEIEGVLKRKNVGDGGIDYYTILGNDGKVYHKQCKSVTHTGKLEADIDKAPKKSSVKKVTAKKTTNSTANKTKKKAVPKTKVEATKVPVKTETKVPAKKRPTTSSTLSNRNKK